MKWSNTRAEGIARALLTASMTARAGQKAGAHEGPRYQALNAASYPVTPSLVPPRLNNGTDPGEAADVQAYNFGSALFASFESGFGQEAIQV